MTIQTFPVSTPIAMRDKAQGFTEKYGASPIMFIAPIDLKTDDRCTIVIESGFLLAIERNSETVWKSWENGKDVEDRP